MPRISEKVVFTILIVITYWGIGDNFEGSNMTNTAAAIFLIVVLPVFGAGIYTPTLVLGQKSQIFSHHETVYCRACIVVS